MSHRTGTTLSRERLLHRHPMDFDGLTIVVGGQYGSEGKGAVTARLHEERDYKWAVRVGGPNAGHSVMGTDRAGVPRKFALRQLPVAAIADPYCELVIAAGSEIDPAVLSEEIELVESCGYPVYDRLHVDAQATLITDQHAAAEAGLQNGTTGKGIGAARADRALRQAMLAKDIGMEVQDTQKLLRDVLYSNEEVMIEGTQGYGLGSHAGMYPFCTSGDCRAIDFMAACGLPPRDAEIWVVLRTHPIRIAGNSGPLRGETTWDEIGVPPEITTVTKKQRRVGVWDSFLAWESVEANRTPESNVLVALTFADYWWPSLTKMTSKEEFEGYEHIEESLDELEEDLQAEIAMIGTGPKHQILRGEW